MFCFGFRRLIENISESKQSSILWHCLKILNFLAMLSGFFPVVLSRDVQYKPILYFSRCADASVDTSSRHNLHHTETEINLKISRARLFASPLCPHTLLLLGFSKFLLSSSAASKLVCCATNIYLNDQLGSAEIGKNGER